jgi:hypothetical protein
MSSIRNDTYGLGTMLTADREAQDVEQPSKKARVLPPATNANEAIRFHFVENWNQVRMVASEVLSQSNVFKKPVRARSCCAFPPCSFTQESRSEQIMY